MALVSTIIRDAYREGNLIAIGTQPTAAQQDEGLRLLNRIISSSYGDDAGEELQPILIGRNNISRPQGFPWYESVPDQTDWFVPSNSRLILNLTSAQTVYLDPNPRDGARFGFVDKSSNLATYNLTINANGRTIANATTTTVSANGAAQEYFYRADTGDWALVDPLTVADTFPFPSEFEDLFVIWLAMRLNPRYTVIADPQSIEAFKMLSRKFKARYRQTREMRSELGLLRTSSNRYGTYEAIRDPQAEFDSGHPY